MSTEKQINANRQNAQKSTGPKTEEGKAAVSKNAIKHGLFAESVVTGEKEAEYEAFYGELLAELAPRGAIELLLAERVVSLSWRLKRAERMQNQAIEDMIGRKVTNDPARRKRECYYINQGIYRGDPRMDLDDLPLGRIAISDWKYSKVLDRMLMYEWRMENSVIKLMKELKRFQTIRRIEWQNAEQQTSTESSPPAKEKSDLKKQSQFGVVQFGARSYLKRDYGDIPAGGAEENKADQTRFQTDMRLIEPVEGETAPALSSGVGSTDRACQ